MLVKQVVAVALNHELVVFVVLAHTNFMPYRHIGLQKRVTPGAPHHTVAHDVAGEVAVQFHEVPASLSPLACRCSSHYRQAGTDRGSFIERLRNTERCFLTEPWQPVEAPDVCCMRTV